MSVIYIERACTVAFLSSAVARRALADVRAAFVGRRVGDYQSRAQAGAAALSEELAPPHRRALEVFDYLVLGAPELGSAGQPGQGREETAGAALAA